MKFKKNDNVIIINGKNKGKTGAIDKVYPKENKLIVHGLNRYKKHLKPTKKSPHGGIIDMDMPVNCSNVMLICPICNKKTKIAYQVNKDNKTRICNLCKQGIDK